MRRSSKRAGRKKKRDKPGKEVSEVVELAVLLILDVDHSPTILAASNWLSVDDDVALRTNNSEGNHALLGSRKGSEKGGTYPCRGETALTRICSFRRVSSSLLSSLSKG